MIISYIHNKSYTQLHTTTACLHIRDARHLCQPPRTGEMKLHYILPFVFFLFEAL